MTTLTAVYDALIAGDIPTDKATAAVEAIELARDEPWKRKTEADHADLKTEVREGFARLETRMEGGFEQVDERFKQVDARIARFETRVENRFEQVDARFDKVDTDIRGIRTDLDELKSRFGRLEVIGGILVLMLVPVLARAIWG